MGTIKVAILEKDGVEYDTPTEIDLISALSHVGAMSGSNIPEYSSDPINPSFGDVWVLKVDEPRPCGLLLSITQAVKTYYLSYKTNSGTIIRKKF